MLAISVSMLKINVIDQRAWHTVSMPDRKRTALCAGGAGSHQKALLKHNPTLLWYCTIDVQTNVGRIQIKRKKWANRNSVLLHSKHCPALTLSRPALWGILSMFHTLLSQKYWTHALLSLQDVRNTVYLHYRSFGAAENHCQCYILWLRKQLGEYVFCEIPFCLREQEESILQHRLIWLVFIDQGSPVSPLRDPPSKRIQV